MKLFKKGLNLIGLGLLTATFASCSTSNGDVETIKVGASTSPHAEILNYAKTQYEAKGYKLKVVEYDDYVQPNLAVESGDIDANYFQHITYLNEFNVEHETHLVSIGDIHYEPFGIYKGTKSSLSEIANGDKIIVPNDTTNEARALLLLQEQGIITLKANAGINATKNDIESNPYNLDIVEVNAEQVAANRKDGAFAVVNGNYALTAGITDEIATTKDGAKAYESSTGTAAESYKNVVAVKEGNETKKALLDLVEVLKSDDVKNWINNQYNGTVVAL